jgi:hypothetical protein
MQFPGLGPNIVSSSLGSIPRNIIRHHLIFLLRLKYLPDLLEQFGRVHPKCFPLINMKLLY